MFAKTLCNVNTTCKIFPYRRTEKKIFHLQLLSGEMSPHQPPEKTRVNGTICNPITSNTASDRWLCGTFVSSALQFFAYEHYMFGGFWRACGHVLRAQTWTENMSDPVPDQSSHHSNSVTEDKIQTVTSGSLAAAAACCFCEISNAFWHLCYLCHHIISFMCFSSTHFFALCLFLFCIKSLRSNLDSEIREH